LRTKIPQNTVRCAKQAFLRTKLTKYTFPCAKQAFLRTVGAPNIVIYPPLAEVCHERKRCGQLSATRIEIVR
jgi:hypothetical protein